MRGALDATLCDKVCQWRAAGQWFSPDIQVYSTNKTDPHDIAEILLKVALKHHKSNQHAHILHCYVKLQVQDVQVEKQDSNEMFTPGSCHRG